MATPSLGRLDVVSFPVPGFKNRLLRVLRDPGTAEYELLPTGTPLEECPFIRGADLEGMETGYLLTKVVPQPNSGLEEWYFLNERSNEDEYNFETSYEGEDKEYPVVTRSYLMLRSRYEALTFSDTDPKDSRLTLSAQRQARAEDPIVDSLFVAVQRVFQRIPGKALTGKVVTREGQVGTLTRQVVAPGTSIEPSSLTVSGTVQPETGGRSVLEKVEVDEVFPGKVFAIEKPDPAPPKFRVELPAKTEEITEEGEAEEVALSGEELAKSEQQLTKFTKRTRKTTREAAPNATLSGKRTGVWGEESVTETYDENGNIVPGYKTLSARKEALGGGKFLGEKVVVASPSELVEQRIDPDTSIALTITKTLVPANQALPEKPPLGGVEKVPIDAWNSVQIVTRVDALPPPEIFETTLDMTYPDELLEVGVLWELSSGGAAGSGGIVSIAKIIQEKYSWSSTARAESFIQVVGSVYVRVKDGHRGKVRAQVQRTYLNAPPDTPPLIKTFRPVNGAVVLRGRGLSVAATSSVSGQGDAQANSSGSQSFRSDAFARSVPFGPVLHNGVTLVGGIPPSLTGPTYTASGGSIPGGGTYPAAVATATAQASAVLELPASDLPPTPGSSHVELVRVEKWRFGIWVREIYTAFHP
jgi:hypothetical protein